jgi:hypothetical protein
MPAIMARTMVANITGARLREAERQLALLRGEAAVNEYLETHPNETKVLQQLVDWRRAGKPAPSLARVQRAMVWSDGTIELNTVAAPEPAPRPGPGRDGRYPRDNRNGRREQSGPPRRDEGAPPRRGRPGQRRDDWGSARESTAGMPRAGEGWALIRAGETPPPDAPLDGSAGLPPQDGGTAGPESEAAGAPRQEESTAQ